MNESIDSKKPQPWKTQNWFVSPWNYLEEVTRDFQPPKEVKIHDITLLTMYGIDVGINYSRLNELSKLVQEFSGTKVPACRPFIGEGAYTIESGIVTGWYKNVFEANPTTVFPVHPDFVGHERPKIVMGKKSGLDNIEIWSKKLGIELDDEEALAILREVKLMSHDLKRVLTEEEFMETAERVIQERNRQG